ncbi:biopolymer transporter ExbD [Mitsuaria sp. WAJ17]|uniref:ExbD/TolR family protein n=1 Tax=Mitsuaria sp. WAJ17 TaxID=2761452 RepID=UPI0016034332|nr:biopolymer transporter ExbD [Mitsuaria sp. WAJ17]MBB2485460.1 biopolymer transporter ExbD [Mitsuaria sp. WAJ17]
MGMNVGSSSSGDEADVMMDVNTTPLIDVMLVLLVMLIITIPIQLHSVNMNMPNGAPPPAVVKDPVVVEIFIDFDGTVLWNNEQVDKNQLEARLIEAAKPGPDQPEVHIKPNKLVDYGRVAMVLAAAQRLGVTKMGIVGNEQFVK